MNLPAETGTIESTIFREEVAERHPLSRIATALHLPESATSEEIERRAGECANKNADTARMVWLARSYEKAIMSPLSVDEIRTRIDAGMQIEKGAVTV